MYLEQHSKYCPLESTEAPSRGFLPITVTCNISNST